MRCPKYRRKVFVDGIDERLKAIIRSVVAERDATVIEMEVMPDHVHLLVEWTRSSGSRGWCGC